MPHCLSHNFRTVQSFGHVKNETGYVKECEKEAADRDTGWNLRAKYFTDGLEHCWRYDRATTVRGGSSGVQMQHGAGVGNREFRPTSPWEPVVFAARCQICCASLNPRSVEEENFFIVSLAFTLIFLQLYSFSETPMYGYREDLPSI